jgi:hypothetical protein
MQMQETARMRTQAPKRLFTVSNRTREGRFLKHCETQLVAQLGGDPSFAQLVLVRRAARAALQLEKLDAKMASGNWTDHDSRTFGGLNTRGDCAYANFTWGVKAKADRTPSLADYIASKRAAPGSPEAAGR